MKQKTAIDFLIEELKVKSPGLNIYLGANAPIIEQAKAKFREQIYEAFVAGDERGTGEIPFNCEQYYQQKYGDEK